MTSGERRKKVEARRALQGLCAECERPAEPERSRCRRHLDRHAAWYRLSRIAAAAGVRIALLALVIGCCSCGAVDVAGGDAGGDAARADAVRVDGSSADALTTSSDVSCLLPPGTELVRPCPNGSGPACACERFGPGYGPCVPAVCS